MTTYTQENTELRVATEERVPSYTLRLSPDARKALEYIQKIRGGVPLSEVIRRAIGTEQFLVDQIAAGNRILIEDKNKNVREIVLR